MYYHKNGKEKSTKIDESIQKGGPVIVLPNAVSIDPLIVVVGMIMFLEINNSNIYVVDNPHCRGEY